MDFLKRLDLRRFYFFLIFLGISLYLLSSRPVFSAVSLFFTLIFLYFSLPYTVYVTDFSIMKRSIFGISRILIKWHEIKEIDEIEINMWENPVKSVYNVLFFGWFISMLFGARYRQLIIRTEEFAEIRFHECDFNNYEELKEEIKLKARKKIIV